jgi:hypothetical protein
MFVKSKEKTHPDYTSNLQFKTLQLVNHDECLFKLFFHENKNFSTKIYINKLASNLTVSCFWPFKLKKIKIVVFKNYPFLEEVSENHKREANADSDSGGVVEDDVATQGRSVEEQQQAKDRHANLKYQ